MDAYHYISDEQLARIRSLPQNRRIQPGAPVKAPKPTDMEVWQDGFGIGIFFGSLAVDAMILALQWLNG